MSVYDDSLGQTFAELTVIELMGRVGKYHYRVKVRCSCGAEKSVLLADIRSGATVTCGNRTIHRTGADRTRPAFLQVYKHAYQVRAVKKGLMFSITEEEFLELSQQNCHYCGVEPSSHSKSGTSEWKYNGLDRTNPAHGYVIENVVPCCSICNHAKHTMSYETFCAWLDRITATRAKRELHMIEL